MAKSTTGKGPGESPQVHEDRAREPFPEPHADFDSLVQRGNALLRLGQGAKALESYRQVLAADAKHFGALHGSAVALLQLGRYEESVQTCREALGVRPDSAATLNDFGAALRSLGRIGEAEQAFRGSLALDSRNFTASFNLAALLAGREDFPEATSILQGVLDQRPDFAEAALLLGKIACTRKNWVEAERLYRQSIAAQPANPDGWYNLGNALHEQDRIPQAVDAYRQCLKLKPEFAQAENNLANLFASEGRYQEAREAYQRALTIRPDYSEAVSNLGLLLLRNHQIEDAETAFCSAVALRPKDPDALNNLGCALQALGRLDEAVLLYRRALEIDPQFIKAHTNLLSSAHYRPGITLAELSKIHREWNDCHASGLRQALPIRQPNVPPDRPLRLGFVSPDLGGHPVGYFVIRALEAMDRTRFETFCYSDRDRHDSLTGRFIAAAHNWREVRRLSDEQLFRRIREDRIDILFDLAGHTGANRMLVFARRAAPVQISWAGYVGTTGLDEMDFVLADGHQLPAGAEEHFSERILSSPGSYVTYDPPAHAPNVAPLPALASGHVTFGCFNNLAKINADVIRVWARLLERVPGSRLFLKFRGLEGRNRRRYEGLFEQAGVPADRIDLEGHSTHAELLAAYHRVDIALDPFPYSGGLTTCEALWMGVPVLTCPGETFASRHSLSHLSTVGLPEFLAADFDDYVERGAIWAGRLEHLATLRKGLRQRVGRSLLCDGPAFVRGLEELLREIPDLGRPVQGNGISA